jgi:hypothetical protein
MKSRVGGIQGFEKKQTGVHLFSMHSAVGCCCCIPDLPAQDLTLCKCNLMHDAGIPKVPRQPRAAAAASILR